MKDRDLELLRDRLVQTELDIAATRSTISAADWELSRLTFNRSELLKAISVHTLPTGKKQSHEHQSVIPKTSGL